MNLDTNIFTPPDDVADPLSILDSADPGDDTQRRFRYQACIAAIYSLALLGAESKYVAVYCEHHDDILLEERGGNLVAIQVKTRSENRVPLKASDESVKSALARFVLKDRQFPGRFRRFLIVTNGGFWGERKDRHNLLHILDIVRNDTGKIAITDKLVKPSLTGITTEANKRLKEMGRQSGATLDAETVLSTLRKTFTSPGSGLDDVEARVIRTVQQHGLLQGYPAEVGAKIARSLIAYAERAASRPPDSVSQDLAVLSEDPVTATEQSVIRQKRITAEDVLAVFAEHGVRGLFKEEGNIVSPSAMSVSGGISSISPASIPEIPSTAWQPSVLLSIPPSADVASMGSPLNNEELAAQAQFEVIRSLTDSGRVRAAQETVNALREKSWAKVSLAMRAKIANSQATVAFRLDNLPAARILLEEALAYDPRNPVILTNLASVFLLSGEPVKSLEYSVRARELEPANDGAAAIYLQALHDTGQDDRLDAELADENNAWMRVSPVSRAALASVVRDRGEYGRAKELLLDVVKASGPGKPDPQHLMLLGSVIVTPISMRLTHEQRVPDVLTPEEHSELSEAEQVYTTAVDILANYDSREWLHSALVSRGGVRFMLREFDGALKDCERVLGDNPTDWSALENKGRILMAMGRSDEAASVLETLWSLLPEAEAQDEAGPTLYSSNRKGVQRREAIRYALAVAYTQSGQSEKVLELLGTPSGDSAVGGTTPEDFLRAELLLYAASDLPDEVASATADAALAYLRSVWGSDPRTHAVLSQYHANRRETAEAIREMREAVNISDGALKTKYQRVLAWLLYEAREYQEAVALFRPLLASADDDPYLPAFVYSLYQSGQYQEALEVAGKVRSAFGVRAGVSGIEAELLEKEGNLPEARYVLTELIASDPDAYQYRVRLAYLESRAGKHDEAKVLTEAIPYDSIAGHPDLLMNVAKLRSMLGMPGVLRFGYRAQRLASDDPEMRSHYMALFHDLDPDADEGRAQLRDRTVVGEGDAVILKRGSDTINFIIEPEEPVSASRDEIAPHDGRAVRLIGRAKGDRIALPGAFTEGDEYEISEVQHRYLFAYQETIRRLADGRLTHPRMQAFHAGGAEDIQRVLNALGGRQEERPDPWLLYREGQIPFVTLAQFLHDSVVDVWLAISGTSQSDVLAFTRNPEDEKEQKSILDQHVETAISLDVTALLTITHLGLEDTVRSRFRRIVVPQAVLDHLVEYERQTVGMMGTKFVLLPGKTSHFLSAAERNSFVRRLLDFARQVEVVPTRGLLQADQRLIRYFGEPTLAAMLSAQEQSAVLYADDFRLRQFALGLIGVPGIDSQAVLADLRERNELTKERHALALSTLARSRYRQVYMDDALLLQLLDGKGYLIDEDVRAAFALFAGPDCEEESALSAMAIVMKGVWHRSLLEHQQVALLDLALLTVVTGRDLESVLGQWLPMLRSALSWTPQIYARLILHLRLWLIARRQSL